MADSGPTQPPSPIFNLPTYLLGQHIDTQESIGADYQDGGDAFTDTEMVVLSNDAGEVHIPRCIQLQGAPDTRYAVGVPVTHSVTHSVTEIVIGGTNQVSAWTEQTTQLSVDGTDYKLMGHHFVHRLHRGGGHAVAHKGKVKR